jgi:hypothetical protein
LENPIRPRFFIDQSLKVDMISYVVLKKYGPLAHLVERIHGMDEVTGSIPVRSTVNMA